jgi:hypothetical protein
MTDEADRVISLVDGSDTERGAFNYDRRNVVRGSGNC